MLCAPGCKQRSGKAKAILRDAEQLQKRRVHSRLFNIIEKMNQEEFSKQIEKISSERQAFIQHVVKTRELISEYDDEVYLSIAGEHVNEAIVSVEEALSFISLAYNLESQDEDVAMVLQLIAHSKSLLSQAWDMLPDDMPILKRKKN